MGRSWSLRRRAMLIFAVLLLWETRASADAAGGIVEWADSVAVTPTPPATRVTPETEALARSAQSLGLYATGGLSLVGGALIVSGSDNGGNGGMQGLGVAMLGTGVLFGPSIGWARAGYWDRAAGGAVGRIAIVGLGFSTGLLVGVRSNDGWEGLGIVLLGITTGVCAATLEGLVECGHMGRYIRTHGRAGEARVSLLTPHGPGLAVTLPLP